MARESASEEMGDEMSLFEFERGRLIPAQFGRPVDQGLGPEILESVRSQVLEVIGRPLFPVAWQAPESEVGPDGGPHCLTALDASGQVVSVEVLQRLDAVSLISAMGRLGEIAKMGWLELAHVYPGGPDAFRAGWAEFRESMPPTVEPGPRLFLVVGDVEPGVDSALVILASAGLEIHQVRLREMSNGRRFLEVHPVSLSAFASRPQLGGHSAPAPQLEWSGEAARGLLGEDWRAGAAAADQRPGSDSSRPRSGASASPAPRPAPAPSASPRSSHPGQRPAPAPDASAPETAARTRTAPTPTRLLARDGEGLRAIAEVIGEPTVLVNRDPAGRITEAMLTADGRIDTGEGHHYTDADDAYASLTGRVRRGWTEWHIGHFDGPTLSEALDEMNADRRLGR